MNIHNQRHRIARLAAVAAIAFGFGVAQAAPLTYDITVGPNGWFNSGHPFGMPFSPTLHGSITVDSSIAGIAGLLDFSLQTGTHTWIESEFLGQNFADLSYDGSGNLTGFSLNGFQSAGASMYIYSNNTMSVSDGAGGFNACNDCVSFIPSIQAVPEPGTLALIGLALAGAFGMPRRRIHVAAN